MKKDYERHLAQLAVKYDLELLVVQGVRNQQDVAIAELAIAQLDFELLLAGHLSGMTVEAHSGVSIAARRRDGKRSQFVHSD